MVQLSDIHWRDGSPHEPKLLSMMENILEREKPDLVVLNGDSVHSPPRTLEGLRRITREQIRWFESASRGRTVPSLLFLHIPLPEFLAAWEKGHIVGQKCETVCAPELNSGFFAAAVESGNVLGVFAGRDHDNDFAAHLQGVSLCYGRSLGLDTYGNLPRGARVIELREGQPDFESWIREESGAAICKFTHTEVQSLASACGENG